MIGVGDLIGSFLDWLYKKIGGVGMSLLLIVALVGAVAGYSAFDAHETERQAILEQARTEQWNADYAACEKGAYSAEEWGADGYEQLHRCLQAKGWDTGLPQDY